MGSVGVLSDATLAIRSFGFWTWFCARRFGRPWVRLSRAEGEAMEPRVIQAFGIGYPSLV